jgi:anti-anti-sigma factor
MGWLARLWVVRSRLLNRGALLMLDEPFVALARPVLVVLPAEIDMANADYTYMEIVAEFARGAQVVVADMTATTFCDTMGMRALVLAHRQAVGIGAELRLALPSPNVLRVMQLLGLDTVLSIYRSLDEALASHAVTIKKTA